MIVITAADLLPGQIHKHEPPSFWYLKRVAFTFPALVCALTVAVLAGHVWPLHGTGVTGPSLGPAGVPHT